MFKLDKFKKIKGIKEVQKYGLPTPETIFIFDFNKQEKEIENFMRNRDFLMIRSDSKNLTDFCPHNLICPKNKAKKFMRKLNSKGYAIILQECIPWTEDKISGNILTLKSHFILELMKGGPLILLNRDGKIDEYIKIKRDDLKETEHSGKRLIQKNLLTKILNLVSHLPSYKIIEFSIGPDWLYFWQIRSDKTAKKLED